MKFPVKKEMMWMWCAGLLIASNAFAFGASRSLWEKTGDVKLPFVSNLPILHIVTENQKEIPDSKEDVKGAMLMMREPTPDGKYFSSPTPDQLMALSIKVRVRGTSTNWSWVGKKQYQFEILDQKGEEIETSFLGMAKGEKWILQAHFFDRTHMRNTLAYELSRQMGHYASQVKFVEVVINGSYHGVYALMEKMEREKERVNIAKAKKGGFLIEKGEDPKKSIEEMVASGEYFVTDNGSELGTIFEFQYPKEGKEEPEVYEKIKSRINSFEKALVSPNFTDPLKGYRPHIDVMSFVDFFWIQEIFNNADAFRRSVFVHGNVNGPLVAGPVWDFDMSSGNVIKYTESWRWALGKKIPFHVTSQSFWFTRMMQDKWFASVAINRWFEMRNSFLNKEFIHDFVWKQVDQIEVPMKRNFKQWAYLTSNIPYLSFPHDRDGEMALTYRSQVDGFLYWIEKRLDWIDQHVVEELLGHEMKEIKPRKEKKTRTWDDEE